MLERILPESQKKEDPTVESRMIRYLYGPWDHLYYPVLAYLIGKRLIEVQIRKNTEIFRLTAKGFELAGRMSTESTYSDVAGRAKLVRALFYNFSGTRLKDFIYRSFPEVVAREIGGTI